MSQKVDHRVIVELVVAGQTVGFVGALVAGLAAKERKEEAERLNKRLVAVNKQLREVARADRKRESTAAAAAAAPQHTGAETQPADGPAQELLSVLRGGKALLKQRDGAGARPSPLCFLFSLLSQYNFSVGAHACAQAPRRRSGARCRWPAPPTRRRSTRSGARSARRCAAWAPPRSCATTTRLRWRRCSRCWPCQSSTATARACPTRSASSPTYTPAWATSTRLAWCGRAADAWFATPNALFC